MTPERGILELIVERLEPLVGHMRSAWVGSKGEKLSPERWVELYLARAFLMAREALQSNDEARIVNAARWAPGFERAGMALREGLRVSRDKQKRKRGGDTRGDRLSTAAKAAWAPYVLAYHDLRAKGVSVPDARRRVGARIAKEKFIPPGGKGEPYPRTVRKWLRD